MELVTTVININQGYNDGVKARSGLLKQYGEFVDMIHQYQKEVPIQEAMKLAIDYCIKNRILKDFLEKEREAATLAYKAEKQYGLGHSDEVSQGILQGGPECSVEDILEKVGKNI